MGTAKLMTPLFYDGNYNVEKKRMRAVLICTQNSGHMKN